ncbi:MAG TPA: hypothetical protein VFX37_10195 [Pseudolabrys sp.]|nr:hypothetical protein [Pseudolabrys sp.]
MKKYSLDDLKSMTPEQRAVLYQNAKKRRADGGEEIINLIDSSGLSLSSGGMRSTDPEYIEMEEIVWSAEGRLAAIDATEKGLPALAGMEHMIVDALGDRYHPHDGGTVSAGYIVAGLMRHLDYVENGEGKMPPGSIAKTAMKWKPHKQ